MPSVAKIQSDVSTDRIKKVRNLLKGTVREAILALFERQEVVERVEDESYTKNRIGFSRGTCTWGSVLAKKVLENKDWSEWEEEKARSIVAIHQKQLQEAGVIPSAP